VLKPALFSRILHKWLGLFVGLQILIWLSSGLYMVLVDIDFIHGDSLVKNMQQAVVVPRAPSAGIAALRARYPQATDIGLKSLMGKAYYTVTTKDARYLLNPQSGEVQSPLDEKAAREIARYHYNGQAPVARASLITSDPPTEIQTRRLPLWRIDFDDRFSTSFYVDPYTGALATRRHQYWRIFDFLWMLHIMDYEERADAHNLLLIVAQSTGLTFTITGLWLLFYSFSGRSKKKAPKIGTTLK
jgi:uncharacterized iron-regulated membrane protein